MACLNPLNVKASEQERAARLNTLVDKWTNHKVIKAMTGGRANEFERFYSEILPNLDFEFSRLPNAKELNKLDKKMDKFLKGLTKTPGKIGQLFNLPENILRKNPITKKYYNNLIQASNYYHGNLQTIGSDLAMVKNSLNRAMNDVGFMNKYGFGRGSIQKELNKHKTTHEKLMSDGKVEEADAYAKKWLENVDPKSQMAVNNALYDLMIDPSKIKKQDLSAAKLKYGPEIVEAVNMWHYGKPSENIKPLKNRLWKVLGNGILDYVEVLKSHKNEFNDVGFQIKQLENMYKTYFSSKATKKPKDYFPTQILDIAPTFAKFSQDMFSGKMDTNYKDISSYMSTMIKNVSDNLNMPSITFEKKSGRFDYQNKDVIGLLDTFSNNVIRFNYNARVTKETTNALKELGKLEGKDYDQHLQFLAGYIGDTHEAVLGTKFRDSKLAHFSRAITSFQFISKLGLNLRSSARNATQSLQNWVYFGSKGIYTAMKDMQSESMKTIVDSEMKKHGFEFVNIQELAMPKDLMRQLEVTPEGRVVEKGPSTVDKVNDWFENVARVTGKPMQWVENNINRGLTFKIAFMTKYRDLKKSEELLRKTLKASKDQEMDITPKVEKQIIDKASQYGAELVKELHYQYDRFAKPNITKTPVGAVLGQFSTYAFNFFNYQAKIARRGGNEVLAGEWSSPEAQRLYRLGMLYTMVTGLSALTNTNFNNLIQNDTLERGVRLKQYLLGDKEAKKKAFYGLDPITGTFGGPFISDLLRIGHAVNFMGMNGKDWTTYANGYIKFNERHKTSATEEIVRTLNTQIGRLVYTTIPRSINGTGVPTLLGQELGLYGTPELSSFKDAMLMPMQKYMPKPVSEYFTPKKSKKEKKYSDDELMQILSSLGTFNQ
tara:strand:+ start:5086 stop:7740 length:2655 start_codon:yes stop_codon:yes gene_type:complete